MFCPATIMQLLEGLTGGLWHGSRMEKIEEGRAPLDTSHCAEWATLHK